MGFYPKKTIFTNPKSHIELNKKKLFLQTQQNADWIKSNHLNCHIHQYYSKYLL